MDIFDLNSYGYDLPRELVADLPKKPRDVSRLMKVDIPDETYEILPQFRKIEDFLDDNCVVVMNNTKVFPARVLAVKKMTKARVEMLCLQCVGGDLWEVMCKKASKVQVGDVFLLHDSLKEHEVFVEEVLDSKRRLIRVGLLESDFYDLLSRIGSMPLPPYINCKQGHDYKSDYQTVFARQIGSVAAPTAGLHFTVDLIDRLRSRGVIFEEVTLHVGLGTFLPVDEKDIRQHNMHSENMLVDRDQIGRLNNYKKEGKRIVAVGTTSTRYLESLVGGDGYLQGDQSCLSTNLFIYPGYKFGFVDELITNFHLPFSTLLMLVAAFIYDKGNFSSESSAVDYLFQIYGLAVKEKMRFYSFGDAMYIY